MTYMFDEKKLQENLDKLKEMPKGWYEVFGNNLASELRTDIIKHRFADEFDILDVKEKFGGLRIYISAIPINSKAVEIIDKYERQSFSYCQECGSENDVETVYVQGRWIQTLCDNCRNNI